LYLPRALDEMCYPLARSFLLPTCPVRTVIYGTAEAVPFLKAEFLRRLESPTYFQPGYGQTKVVP
jgi:hypothetical protein